MHFRENVIFKIEQSMNIMKPILPFFKLKAIRFWDFGSFSTIYVCMCVIETCKKEKKITKEKIKIIADNLLILNYLSEKD